MLFIYIFPLPDFSHPSPGNGFGEMDRRHWLTDEGEEAVKVKLSQFLERQTPVILLSLQLCKRAHVGESTDFTEYI